MMGRPARELRTGKMANWSEWSHSRRFVTAANASFHQGILVSSELLDYQSAAFNFAKRASSSSNSRRLLVMVRFRLVSSCRMLSRLPLLGLEPAFPTADFTVDLPIMG